MSQKKNATMSEREMMEDALSSQKQISADYNTCAGTCSDEQLRAALLNILTDEHRLAVQISDEMSARGWCQTKQAQQSDVVKTKEKFVQSAH